MFYIKRNTLTAILPKRGSAGAAGFDICADLGLGETLTVWPQSRILVPTGLSAAVSPGIYLRIAPRSGLANKNGIDVLAGVVDSDYRGDIGVILINFGGQRFDVHHGDRIAQMIPEFYYDGALVETDYLPETVRGSGGFGSTGTGALKK